LTTGERKEINILRFLKDFLCFKKMGFTATYFQDDGMWVGFVNEIPGVNSQGESEDELLENLQEALQMILEVNRELSQRTAPKKQIFHRSFAIA